MDQIQIQVFQSQIRQGSSACGFDMLRSMECVPQLRSNPQLFSGNNTLLNCFFDTLANFMLVAVIACAIDEPITCLDGIVDSLRAHILGDFPSAQPKYRHLISRGQFQPFSTVVHIQFKQQQYFGKYPYISRMLSKYYCICYSTPPQFIQINLLDAVIKSLFCIILMGQKYDRVQKIDSTHQHQESQTSKYYKYIIRGEKEDRKISSGGYGKVYQVQQKSNTYAMKIVPVKETAQLQKIVMEAQLMKELTSEFVVPIRQSFFTKDKKQFCIVMEQCESSLEQIFKNFSLLQKKEYSRNLIKAVAFLHKNGKVHRDIKLENILKIRKRVKIGDFGVSVAKTLNMNSEVGTPYYQAKQVKQGEEYTSKVDSWSLGLTLLQMWSGKRLSQLISRSRKSPALVKDFPNDSQLNLIEDSTIRRAVTGFLIEDPQLRLSVVEAQQQLSRYSSQPCEISGMFYINVIRQMQRLDNAHLITNLSIRQSTMNLIDSKQECDDGLQMQPWVIQQCT